MNLQQLAQEMERQKRLLAMDESLRRQEADLQAKADRLHAAWVEEQEDVERLNRLSLAAVFYDLLGKKEEQLEKEHREAVAAAAKYQTAKAELENIQKERHQIRAELSILDGCEERYRQACDDRIAVLRSTDSEQGAKIIALEKEEAAVCAQLHELGEAVQAAKTAADVASQVRSELDSAESWGTWDLLGGGIIADMVKHDHLDSAQSAINHLQSCLRNLKTELVDVHIHVDMEVNTDDFLRFADWFFDGLFADWAMQDRIEEAQNQISAIADQIQTILNRLYTMEEDLKHRRETIQQEIDALVIG